MMIPHELLVKIMNDPKQRSDFLDICYNFLSQVMALHLVMVI